MRGVDDYSEVVVFGSRGNTVSILTALEEIWQGRVRLRAMVDEIENGHTHPTLGVPVLSADDRARHFRDVPVLLTPADGAVRERMARRLADEGTPLATFATSHPWLRDPDLRVGPGSLIGPFTRIGAHNVVGAGCLIIGSVIAHDCVLGDFVTVGYGAALHGHVEIGDGATIAPAAVIGNGTRTRPMRIGAGAVVGTGAVVLHDVPPGARVIGNPAMPVTHWPRLRRLLARPR